MAAVGETPEPRTGFSIPGGSLDAALEALARQSGIQLLYAPELVAGRRSEGLRGDLAPADALARLLRGTGLQAVAVNPRTFLLQRRPEKARLPAPAPVQPAGPRSIAELDAVQVTGSRIGRESLGIVTPSPVSLITREDIEASGYQTLFDLLRTRPGMVGHHPVDVAVEGGRTGIQQPFATAATTSLNALGPRATLFLVDGRRVATYGLISTELGGLIDLDSIPLSMVERIEILRGGASAIYGADAMAGVVNVILRRSQEDATVQARLGQSDRGDAQEWRISVASGIDTRRGGHVFLTADHFEREGLIGADRRWRTFDRRGQGLGDWRYQLGYRDDFYDMVGVACPVEELGPNCLFDPPRYGTLQPAQDRTSFYGRWQEAVGEHAELDVSLRVSDAAQRLVGAPFYARITLPEAPAEFPDAAYLDYAFFDVGPVSSRSDTRNVDLGLGLRMARGDWDWSFQLSRSENRVDSRVDGLVQTDALFDALERGDYRFNAPDNPPEVLAAISPQVNSSGSAAYDEFAIETHGPWFTLPGGEVQVAAGGEVGRDTLHHRPDALIVDSALALAPQKTRIDASRYAAALFVEASLPISARLQTDLAARLDYREGYGTRISPKLGLKWQAGETVTLRGTYATGYRAPSLFEQREPVVLDSFDIVRARPGFEPCRWPVDVSGTLYCIVERGAIGNPELAPETSRNFTLGLVWAPTGSFSLELDRFRIERRNEILAGSALLDVDAFGRSLRRDSSGLLVGIDDYFANVGRTEVRGWELDARYTLDTARFGSYSFQLAGQFVDRLERQSAPGLPALDHAGHGAPDRSGIASLQWRYADWTARLSARALGPVELAQAGEACPWFYAQAGRCVTPGWTTWDVHLAYTGVPRWSFSLNVRNLADRDPVNYDVDKAGYDIAYDEPRGRFFMVGVGYRFD